MPNGLRMPTRKVSLREPARAPAVTITTPEENARYVELAILHSNYTNVDQNYSSRSTLSDAQPSSGPHGGE